MRLSLKTTIAIVLIAGVSIAILQGMYSVAFKREFGENVEHVDWLPPATSQISYCRSYTFTACEFDISEIDFVDWCPKELREVTEPITIVRWNKQLFTEPDPYDFNSAIAYDKACVEYHSQVNARISNGLYSSEEFSGHGFRMYAYDREKCRAYVAYSPR